MSALTFYTLDEVADMLKVSRARVDDVSVRYPFLFKQLGRHIRTSSEEVDEISIALKATDPEPNREPVVYVVGFGPYVKIGMTYRFRNRLATLQTGAPEQITTYALLDGAALLEKWLHERFASLRLNGEWFRKEGELDEWIKAGCKL